eukprot:CAMPEP_0113413684 /NCGR_PEP_ID=MMETSP0013_2-20120614/23581_1 /TAXON_ID=2843 ORGANISM="Skeletonema costatum, Strain 1716" /NCGR_SAMPLE_ID=MMETSP0013_2 /ASSEMBLY_ACC=CAM_ASM_000158 /LENGTH=440 /DNA_ID=CAMNT_0000300423 /DNA_START=52 /DNA_END=1374 /DNA_ORIENTATION=+ /assembly_acc=CAM_ASM_000158
MRFAASCVGALVATISVARVHSFSIARHDVIVDLVSSSSIASHHCPQQLSSSCGERRIIHGSTRDVKLRAKPNDEDETIIDAIVEEKTAGLALNDEENTTARKRKRDIFKSALRDLASLSLVDYKWRSALFKKNEADRMEEEWMARMMGEDPAYARPMDADETKRGPLGNAEKSAVQWLMDVIEEEGKRAKRIAESDGELIRPKDNEEGGPLSDLERRAVQFLADVSDSEVERVRSGTVRPKDMNDKSPLGNAEARAVLALQKVIQSEKARMDQSRRRGGEAVRPIDVPGPLGEFERYVGDIIRSERQRVKDRELNEGKLVRPKDASITSGLGEVERKAVEDWETLQNEEKQRLLSLRRFLSERRPMEADRESPLGVTEAFTVALLKGPKLVAKVADRVTELLKSEELETKDLNLNLPPSEDEDINEDTQKRKKKDDQLP